MKRSIPANTNRPPTIARGRYYTAVGFTTNIPPTQETILHHLLGVVVLCLLCFCLLPGVFSHIRKGRSR